MTGAFDNSKDMSFENSVFFVENIDFLVKVKEIGNSVVKCLQAYIAAYVKFLVNRTLKH